MAERKGFETPKTPVPEAAPEGEAALTISERPTDKLPPKPEKTEGKEKETKDVLKPEIISFGKEFGMSLSDDSYLERLDGDGKGGLFAVADGMGGYPGGDIASGTLVETLETYATRLEGVRKRREQGDEKATLELEAELLRKAMRESNARIVLKRENFDVQFMHMGTTCTALRLTRDKEGNYYAIIGHAGDSRGYILYPDGRFETVTLDDHLSFAFTKVRKGEAATIRAQDILDNISDLDEITHYQKMLAEGKPFPQGTPVTEEEIRYLKETMEQKDLVYYFNRRSELFQSFGNNPEVKMKIIPVPRGAKFALATDAIDGLKRTEVEAIIKGEYGKLDDPDVRQAVESWGSNTAQALAFAAHERGEQITPEKFHPKSKGADDTTVIAVAVPEG